MIVHCPSCTTLFRYQGSGGAMAIQANCSQCGAFFELWPSKRAYAIVAETEAAIERAMPSAEPAAAAPVPPAGRGEAEPWNPPDGMKLGSFEYEPDAEATAQVAAAEAQAARSAVGEWLTALFLGGVGAGSGYYLALLREADLTTFIAGGSAIGLTLGWAVIRWMAREP